MGRHRCITSRQPPPNTTTAPEQPSQSLQTPPPQPITQQARKAGEDVRTYSGATVTVIPSSSGAQVIWQDSRELGSTASAMSSMSTSASERAGSLPNQSPVT